MHYWSGMTTIFPWVDLISPHSHIMSNEIMWNEQVGDWAAKALSEPGLPFLN